MTRGVLRMPGPHVAVVHEAGRCPCGSEHRWCYYACRCGVAGLPRARRETARRDCTGHLRAARVAVARLHAVEGGAA